MDEVATVTNSSNNSDSIDWWSGTVEEDTATGAALQLDEVGLWSGSFVPPPPRPIFLDDSATPDGLTTCDLCTWAWQEGKTFTLDAALEAPGELGWVLTLIIVSLISALIGAIVMIIALHCKRMKNAGLNVNESRTNNRSRTISTRAPHRPPISTPDDKSISAITPASFPGLQQHLAAGNNNGVWSWLSRRPNGVQSPTAPAAENHYTHMDETYNAVGEALYAELDRDSESGGGASPAYQNSAYTDPDAPVSSAPSSAYYSDLSVTTMPERAYEVVGLATLTPWDRTPPMRLASISEAVSVPSDYV